MITYFSRGLTNPTKICSTGLKLSEVDKSQPIFGMMRSKVKYLFRVSTLHRCGLESFKRSKIPGTDEGVWVKPDWL